jgi:phenylalanyl-tRNA synthetase beta chain
MKVPLSWLKEFLPIELSPKEIAVSLTLLGIEVENIEERALPFQGVVVGQVLSVSRHPNAERLQVAHVTDGTQEYQVVCGAPNCRAGLVTAFARIGAVLTDNEQKAWKIKKSKIREIESQGMLCSAAELGLSSTDDGIMELSTDWQIGADLKSFYSDPIFDISLTPNLGHCLSILGIARELGAALNLKAKRPDFCIQTTVGPVISKRMSISIDNFDLCPRYALRSLQNIKVGPSPDSVVRKLEACGIRSINNVVDIGNLVMLETGQPLHIFDAGKIIGNTLIVSNQTNYSSLITLDEKEHPIPPHALLICDKERPLAFAGIMGGLSSAVTRSTTDIVIEAAVFSPSSIRKTARALDVRSDSSYRFERGVDPRGLGLALDRACFLIQELAGGEIVQGMIDVKEKEFLPQEITCRVSRVNAILGTSLSRNEIISLLERLDMEVKEHSENELVISVPTYRVDIQIEVDLIEEVAKVFGYNNLPKTTPVYRSSTVLDTPLYAFEKEIHNLAVQAGLQECVTCDLISPTLAKLTMEKGLAENATIAVLHPRSFDQSVLRTSLLPGLLEVIKHNANHQVSDISAFELGKIHFKEGDGFKEQPCLGLVLTGKKGSLHWSEKPKEVDFFDLKGIVQNLFQGLGLIFREPLFEPTHFHTLHPGRQAQIKLGKQTIGVIGEVHPEILASFGLDQRVLFGELNLQELLSSRQIDKKCQKIPSFPGSERDWTLTLKSETPMAKVFEAIERSKPKFLERYALIDVFTGEKLGPDRKNATLRFIYRDQEKTISLETVDTEHQRLLEATILKLADWLIH